MWRLGIGDGTISCPCCVSVTFGHNSWSSFQRILQQELVCAATACSKGIQRMEGEEYIAINPDTLHDSSHWSYRDLQKLCRKLNLGGKGSRSILEQKLLTWHRERPCDEESAAEMFEMNVPGNNFSLLQVNVVPSSRKKASRRSSIGLDDDKMIVDPIVLKPFKNNKVEDTPKGILKKRPSYFDIEIIDNDDDIPNSSSKKLSKLTFSPYNGVKVISHRHKDLVSVNLFQ